MTPRLHIDLETYSEADIKKVGAYAYSMHPSTRVLMMAWAVDDGPVKMWLPDGLHEWPAAFQYAEIHAWNDFFEHCMLCYSLNHDDVPPEYWHDTAARAAALALPRSLEDCGEALGLPVEHSKSKEGKALIAKFSRPRRYKGTLTRTRPEDDPEAFERFKEYCRQDVIAEREISKRLYSLRPESRRLWEYDRKINLRGVRIDVPAVKSAIKIREEAKAIETKKIYHLTHGRLDNIASPKQLKEYCERKGHALENAQREYLKRYAADCEDTHVKAVIEARLRVSKSSLAKYDKLLSIIPEGDRAYGLLRFHGASTGRWSGNLFQPQNLPRPSFWDTDNAAQVVGLEDLGLLETLYGDPLEALSSCLRSMIIPSDGCRLIVSDFSQIESRVLKWLAGDPVGLRAYREGLDIYKVNAAAAFKVKYDDVTKDQRTIGKVIELACGYQGAVGAFQQFADVYGVSIPDAEAEKLVGAWRTANPKIVSMWYNCEAAAVKAVAHPGSIQRVRGIQYKVDGHGRQRWLFCKLPSGRCLAYHRPQLFASKFDKMQIKFWGVDSKTHKYCEQRTYGGKLVENITQAVACDLMSHKIPILEKAGYPIVLSVHDELIADVPEGHGSLEEFNSVMRQLPPWADGLPVDADGYEGRRYRK